MQKVKTDQTGQMSRLIGVFSGLNNYENMSMQYTVIFHGSKNEKMKNFR